MNYSVIPTKRFQSDLEYYSKKKKYRKIYDDVDAVVRELSVGNLIGDVIPNLKCDNPTVKVRIANSDTRSGKSNGYRMLYYAVIDDCEIYLLTICSKKDDNNIPTDSEIIDMVNQIIG